MTIGIEAINAYVGRASLDVAELFRVRGLDVSRFGNLMMRQKSVNLPCEDTVTNAVNAARPLLDSLRPDERDRIELVVVGTESGVDYAKPVSTYIHHYLGLTRWCRSFEVKHACFGGTAALRTAAGILGTSTSAGAKALVIAADSAGAAERNSYWEPSQGAGAVAMIVGDDPRILQLDPDAAGFYSHEVMDTARPRGDLEVGDSDLSLMSYLECLYQSYTRYEELVVGADILSTFQHLVFHAPFAGMVKGAHRTLLRRTRKLADADIAADFEARLASSLLYCSAVGNVYSASLYLALCSLIDALDSGAAQRIGLFSYGSGCASEFYSGILGENAREILGKLEIGRAVADRVPLAMPDYEVISDLSVKRLGGVAEWRFDDSQYAGLYRRCLAGRGLLVLDEVVDYHRRYRWS